ncbi:MAG: shikimate dehydrogenase [Flavobacteriaceae bacterium]|jgi:shikimate dehydrogenase|nr:shikimate dehydrogenase [Flavobacteriaceae bacterium]|tara:strand:+ start:28072 stop:28803 length:732 start_codon:yes stop_codon:yes gene_type:complete
MAKYGLIGYNIGYSFSKTFFNFKFEKENRNDSYENFDIPVLGKISEILENNPDLKGLNVTIPYKKSIIQLLDKVDKEALQIGAVNTIKINKDGTLEGYNTDHYGFSKALMEFFPLKEKKALVLGTGGASKAVKYVLQIMNFEVTQVSRTKTENNITYSDLDRDVIKQNYLIVNCTPLGTFPKIEEFPDIPYEYLTKDHLAFDLTYNPRETKFMKLSKERGARKSNGLKMLEYQAKKAWSIWIS